MDAALLNKSNFCRGEGAEYTSSDNTGRPVTKQKFKIPNWRIDNKALINHSSLTVLAGG